MRIFNHFTIILFSICCSFSIGFSQPTSITVSGSMMSDGTYHQNGLFKGCPCYEGGAGVVYGNLPGWVHGTGTCATVGIHNEILSSSPVTCDILSSPFEMGITILNTNQIPTLSQWGLIALGLLLLIIGTLAINRLSVRA